MMLFYSGKRYPRDRSGLWQPREAALYLWTGDRYKLTTMSLTNSGSRPWQECTAAPQSKALRLHVNN